MELTIGPSTSNRFGAAASCFLAVVLCIPLALMLIALSVTLDIATGWRLSLFVMGVGTGWLFVLYIRDSTLYPLAKGSVRFDGDAVTFSCPRLLHAPLVAHRSQIRLGTVDDASNRSEGYFPVRFPVVEDGHPPAGQGGFVIDYLISRNGAKPMFYFGTTNQTPNTVMIFNPPLAAPQLKRKSHGAERWKRGIHGIAFAAEHPNVARDTFWRLGILRDAARSDLVFLDPPIAYAVAMPRQAV